MKPQPELCTFFEWIRWKWGLRGPLTDHLVVAFDTELSRRLSIQEDE